MPTGEEIKNAAVIKKLKQEEEEAGPSLAEMLKRDLPSDLHDQIDGLMDHRGEPELPEDTQSLIGLAAKGDARAAHVLRVSLEGKYEAPKPGRTILPDAKPTGGYGAPDPEVKKSLEELRDGREYSPEVVDGLVEKITDPSFLPPAMALSLFVTMLTGVQPNFMSRMIGVTFNAKAMALYYFFREAEAWTKVNTLLELKEWFVRRDLADINGCGPFERYIQPLKEAARAKDQLKAEEADGQMRGRKDDE